MVSAKPNVILVLTDDQGFADLGCTGNSRIQTPNLDQFRTESLFFDDFHVHPLCTPTRAALMTGRRPVRNGAWATCWGRSILKANETTIANVFRANGYLTGLFGKWHLGDNYPYRPQDRGFDQVVAHKGGGVGQLPDFWGNNYFNDTYFANGKPEKYSGYCTDIWFQQASRFIEESGDHPFFAVIATNAPHSPYLVEERYATPYRGKHQICSPEFYGMISNIDENFGKLRNLLIERALEDNTILMFMTDNGTSAGCDVDEREFVVRGLNAGMRGRKMSRYDGGHRVPWMLRWPDRGLNGDRTVTEMALDIDFFPTLLDLCGLENPGIEFDGTSLGEIVMGIRPRLAEDRVHHIDLKQSTEVPDMWEGCVMTRDWRLVFGRELYNIKNDPEQRHDVSSSYPEVMARLRAEHEQWWTKVRKDMDRYSPISVGAIEENPTRLDAMDVLGDAAWTQEQVAMACQTSGTWAIRVERAGKYRIALCRWPRELPKKLMEMASSEEVASLAPYFGDATPQAFHPMYARLEIANHSLVLPVGNSDSEIVFECTLSKEKETRLDAWFSDRAGRRMGAYYVYVEWVNGISARSPC